MNRRRSLYALEYPHPAWLTAAPQRHPDIPEPTLAEPNAVAPSTHGYASAPREGLHALFSAPEARGWEERTRRLPGPADGGRRKGNAMRDTDEATGTRPLWTVLLGLLVLGLVTSAVPGAARGGHGGGHGGHGGGHGHHGFGHHHHGFGHGGPGVFGPGLGVSIWPYWDPYWAPYAAPPVVVAPPQVYVQPASPLWYACANPQGYYPYVPHCPGGWHPIAPVPPGVVPPSS